MNEQNLFIGKMSIDRLKRQYTCLIDTSTDGSRCEFGGEKFVNEDDYLRWIEYLKKLTGLDLSRYTENSEDIINDIGNDIPILIVQDPINAPIAVGKIDGSYFLVREDEPLDSGRTKISFNEYEVKTEEQRQAFFKKFNIDEKDKNLWKILKSKEKYHLVTGSIRYNDLAMSSRGISMDRENSKGLIDSVMKSYELNGTKGILFWLQVFSKCTGVDYITSIFKTIINKFSSMLDNDKDITNLKRKYDSLYTESNETLTEYLNSICSKIINWCAANKTDAQPVNDFNQYMNEALAIVKQDVEGKEISLFCDEYDAIVGIGNPNGTYYITDAFFNPQELTDGPVEIEGEIAVKGFFICHHIFSKLDEKTTNDGPEL